LYADKAGGKREDNASDGSGPDRSPLDAAKAAHGINTILTHYQKTEHKKTDVSEYPEAFEHVGLLVN
jgi:hypothetical protein